MIFGGGKSMECIAFELGSGADRYLSTVRRIMRISLLLKETL